MTVAYVPSVAPLAQAVAQEFVTTTSLATQPQVFDELTDMFDSDVLLLAAEEMADAS